MNLECIECVECGNRYLCFVTLEGFTVKFMGFRGNCKCTTGQMKRVLLTIAV